MNKTLTAALGLAFLVCGDGFAEEKERHGDKHGHDAVHWGYTGAGAPENWGKLKEEYALCGSGKNQSPVNITNTVDAELEQLSISYQSSPLKVLNNGHTIQVNYAPGSTLTVDGVTFDLLQFHFHSPSENIIDGESFPMEGHFVHKDKDGNLAVIGVMLKAGADNPVIDLIWNNLPQEVNKENVVANTWFSGADLLPQNREYFRFSGSLTTPPCSEGVRWLVMKTPVEMSKTQVDKFLSLIGENARPIQGTYARRVMH